MNFTLVNAKIWEVETKIPHHVKYITTLESDKLTAENITARLKQVNLVSKNDFDNKLISFSRKNTLDIWHSNTYLELILLVLTDFKILLLINQHLIL